MTKTPHNSAFAIAWLDIEQSTTNQFSAVVLADITLLIISS